MMGFRILLVNKSVRVVRFARMNKQHTLLHSVQ